MSRKPDTPLRPGWTTGACAAAAASAAFAALLTGRFRDPVSIDVPGGRTPSFPLARAALLPGRGEVGGAEAGVIKDAGDDPDVTHGAMVLARVRPRPAGGGIVFRAGEGVGTVTRPGLALAVGEPAINPGPRAMIARSLTALAEAHGSTADAEVEIAVPGGEDLARTTLNGRLGIIGGLSILGTTGVVVPYSCSAWIQTIHRGVDVARAASLAHVAAATGRTSEAAVQRLYGLPDIALLDMGDFAGGLLKYLRGHPIPRLSLAGGFGKIAKLAAGHRDLHSARSRVDIGWLAAWLGACGGSAAAVERARGANTAREILEIAAAQGVPLADAVADRARHVAMELAGEAVAVDVLIFDAAGMLVGRAGGDGHDG